MRFGLTKTLGSVVAATLLLGGCAFEAHSGVTAGTPGPTRDESGAVTSRTTAGAPSQAGNATTRVATKVLVVMEENHSYAQMRHEMPFLAKTSDTYGYATHWTAITHPSAPNYLAITGGSTFGITDDAAPAADEGAIGTARSVFDQAIEAGKTAGTYAESMPKNCHLYDYPDRSDGVPRYAVRHNPWAYFSSGRESCLASDQGLPQFATDVADNALPNVGFLVPNLDHDAHDGSLSTADHWLEQRLTPVLSSDDFTSGTLVVVVTADEDDKASGNAVLTSVLTTALSHRVVDTPLTHYSLTRFIAQVLGVTPLHQGADAPDMQRAFGL